MGRKSSSKESSSGKSTSARERARAARLKVDAERAKRDEKIEDAAASYFEAVDARTAIEQKIEVLRTEISAIESTMGGALKELADLGESSPRQRKLFDIDEAERRRLRALHASNTGSKAEGERDGGEDEQPAVHDVAPTVEAHASANEQAA